MAMALHATVKPKFYRGNNFMLMIARVTASGSYTAGGDTLSIQHLARTSKKKPIAAWVQCDRAGFPMTYDIVNEKVKVWTNTAGGVNGELTEHTAAAFAAAITDANNVINLFALFA
jgi:hypothetical protein